MLKIPHWQRRVISFRQAVLHRPTQKGDDMAEVIKLIRESAFGPETIQVMAAALDETWEILQESGSRLARPGYSRAMREVVAKRIFEMARDGVADREELVTGALKFVAASYETPSRAK
jgi:hypothetical protein